MQRYSQAEIQIFKQLDSPKKIQGFINKLKINFEEKGETVYSPRLVLKYKQAHCMEGAMLAAAVLEFHGQTPLLMDLRSVNDDFDHVVAVFKQFNCFGAISKTNHAVLRYREPVYRTVRELALSYFHEYFDDSGKKTLREYSRLLDLRAFDKPALLASLGQKKYQPGDNWRIASDNLFYIPEYLDAIRHRKIMNKAQIKNLRPADKIEIKAGKLVEYKEQA